MLWHLFNNSLFPLALQDIFKIGSKPSFTLSNLIHWETKDHNLSEISQRGSNFAASPKRSSSPLSSLLVCLSPIMLYVYPASNWIIA